MCGSGGTFGFADPKQGDAVLAGRTTIVPIAS
jgi:hypothetical protein